MYACDCLYCVSKLDIFVNISGPKEKGRLIAAEDRWCVDTAGEAGVGMSMVPRCQLLLTP